MNGVDENQLHNGVVLDAGKFLETVGLKGDFGDVDVSPRIHADPVRIVDILTRPISFFAPPVKEVAIEVEDTDAARCFSEVEEVVLRDVDVVWRFDVSPFLQELSVYIEELDTMIFPVGDQHAIT